MIVVVNLDLLVGAMVCQVSPLSSYSFSPFPYRTLWSADKDYQTINEYAHSLGFEGDIQPWDWGYYSEKYKNEKYAVSDEAVKPYFELESAKQAVFMLANKLYGLEFKPAEGVAKYHEDVVVFVQRQNAHAAGVIDHLAGGGVAVGQFHLIHVDLHNAAVKNGLAAQCFFIQFHAWTS